MRLQPRYRYREFHTRVHREVQKLQRLHWPLIMTVGLPQTARQGRHYHQPRQERCASSPSQHRFIPAVLYWCNIDGLEEAVEVWRALLGGQAYDVPDLKKMGRLPRFTAPAKDGGQSLFADDVEATNRALVLAVAMCLHYSPVQQRCMSWARPADLP